jgi:hypothetical protein
MERATFSKEKAKPLSWQRCLGTVALVGLATLLGCARVPVSEVPPPQTERPTKSDVDVLRERAQEYWQARLKDDMPKAYTFEDPLRRKQLTVIEYIRSIGTGMRLTTADVIDARIYGDQADVHVEVNGRYMIPGWNDLPLKRTLIDDWQKIDGEWLHVIDFHLIKAGKPRINPDGTVTYEEPQTLGPAQSKP